MSNQGWISVHRKILNNPVFQDPYLFKLWMYCLLKASHKEHKQLIGKEVVTLEEGQFIWGRNEASNELNNGTRPKEQRSPSTWERHLKLLEELEMLNRSTNNKYTIVNIVNWRTYQDYDDENEQRNERQVNNKRTADEQQVNTNNNVNNANNYINTTTTTKREEISDAIVFYQNNIGMIRPQIAEEIIAWINDFDDEMVIEALSRSISRNKPNWGYARSILVSWKNKNIRTIEQAKAEEVEFKNQQNQRHNFNKFNQPQNQEIIPDWFKKQKEQQSQQTPVEDEKEKAEVLSLLQKHVSDGG